MKVIAVVAGVVVLAAVAIGVVVWNGSGAAAQCDHDQLAAAMHDSVQLAERGGHAQASVNMPDACTDDDMMEAMPGVSRSWHVMSGGMLMRAEHHSDP